MVYVPQTWVDGPDGETPISAARLTHLEAGLVAAAAVADAAAAGLQARPQLVKVVTGAEPRPAGSASVLWLVTDPDITRSPPGCPCHRCPVTPYWVWVS